MSAMDETIKERLDEAGGQYDNCDIRASLMWDTWDDLDLHVIAPGGEEIFFRNKRSRCGGYLDVDMNAGSPSSESPVENVRWTEGKAPSGTYKVFVQNYAYKRSDRGAVDFQVELAIGEELYYFEGATPAGRNGPSSNVTAFEFTYQAGRGNVEFKDVA